MEYEKGEKRRQLEVKNDEASNFQVDFFKFRFLNDEENSSNH